MNPRTTLIIIAILFALCSVGSLAMTGRNLENMRFPQLIQLGLMILLGSYLARGSITARWITAALAVGGIVRLIAWAIFSDSATRPIPTMIALSVGYAVCGLTLFSPPMNRFYLRKSAAELRRCIREAEATTEPKHLPDNEEVA